MRMHEGMSASQVVLEEIRPSVPVAASFKEIRSDEPVAVLVGEYRTWAELDALIAQAAELSPKPLAMVLHLPAYGLKDRKAAGEAVLKAAAGGWKVALTAEAEHVGYWAAAGLAEIAAEAGHAGRIVVEPESDRAVIGAVQWLRAQESIVVFWPKQPQINPVEGLVYRGFAWRGACQDAENGDYASAPAY
jgi:hypothetical protein